VLRTFGVFGYGTPRGAAFSAPTRPAVLYPTAGVARPRDQVVRVGPPRVHYGRVARLPSRRGS
jgi:hypothetical protein